MQHDADERRDAGAAAEVFASGAMTMITVDDPARPAHVARVREEVAEGRYRPPSEAVAERLLAFFGTPSAR